MTAQLDLSKFTDKHKLPDHYKDIAAQWFIPMAEKIAEISRQCGHPVVIGINGSQGSGKSTLADLLVYILHHIHGLSSLPLSIDDFYHSREKRKSLASDIHPLFITRGVPGTHDIGLALQTLADLKQPGGTVKIPRFDKSQDDRYPPEQWSTVNASIDVIILEGWCVGSQAQAANELATPVNTLEASEDAEASWRNYANRQLQQTYPALFSQIDIWIMLKAPSFDCVFDWRLEQEEKLKAALQQQGQVPAAGIMTAEEVARFIQHYQRITEHTLKVLPAKVHFLFELDKHREIIRLSYPVAL